MCGPPRQTTVIQAIFSIELDHQPFLEVGRSLPHDFRVAILENVVTPDFDLTVTRLSTHSGLTSEVYEFPPEVTLVLWHISIKR